MLEKKKNPTRTTRETSSPLAKSKHRILLVKCPVSRRRKKLCSLLAERKSVIHGVSAKCQKKSTPHPFWTPVEWLTRWQKMKYVVPLKKSDNFPFDVALRWPWRTSAVKDLKANKMSAFLRQQVSFVTDTFNVSEKPYLKVLFCRGK